jgi:hypothetical protein
LIQNEKEDENLDFNSEPLKENKNKLKGLIPFTFIFRIDRKEFKIKRNERKIGK